jgi:hypothetical protein
MRNKLVNYVYINFLMQTHGFDTGYMLSSTVIPIMESSGKEREASNDRDLHCSQFVRKIFGLNVLDHSISMMITYMHNMMKWDLCKSDCYSAYN